MNAFDKVIGYASIKRDLIRIADTLKNTDVYRALGANAPNGLLLYGEPGVGKSLMAKCLIEASGRKTFICRKTEPNGEFVKTIKDTFDAAAENAPSIVFMDDMDKFANDDSSHRDSEEYVAVQACIDEVKGKDVFILATANDVGKLPRSLTRAGRFDQSINVRAPRGKDAEDIISHYLSKKKLCEDIDPKTVASILGGRSCAVLETVINEAGLLAGYSRAEHITMEHITQACLLIEYKLAPGEHVPIDLSAESNNSLLVYHESGHAAASELLSPGSVSLVIAHFEDGDGTGITQSRAKGSIHRLSDMEYNILVSLAGRAAVEIRFGTFDVGSSQDIDEAFSLIDYMENDLCFSGFDLYRSDTHRDSNELMARQEAVAAADMARYYQKVKELLVKNRAFLDAVAHALAKKGVLVSEDMKSLRESCAVSKTAVA
ncbi:MAG: AAA family ATPase [Clostridia bacterium]|nr:AAA family ATPase [Clostridia bacterium]